MISAIFILLLFNICAKTFYIHIFVTNKLINIFQRGMQIQYDLKCDRILIAIKELERWKERRDNLAANLAILKDVEDTNESKELNKVKRQINYYDSLTKDMKKEFRPSTLSEFLDNITL